MKYSKIRLGCILAMVAIFSSVVITRGIVTLTGNSVTDMSNTFDTVRVMDTATLNVRPGGVGVFIADGYSNGVINLLGGDLFGGHMYNWSTLNINSNSNPNNLNAYDAAVVNTYSSLGGMGTFANGSHLNVFGGLWSSVSMSDSSIMYAAGGTISNLILAAYSVAEINTRIVSLAVNDHSTAVMPLSWYTLGSGLYTNGTGLVSGSGILSGMFTNGTAFTTSITRIDPTASLILELQQVPEPSTMILSALAIIVLSPFIRRRR